MRRCGQFCRKYFTVSALMLSLACSAFAGEMQNPAAPERTQATASINLISVITLDLLQSVLSLF
jgi:hypothetical protein